MKEPLQSVYASLVDLNLTDDHDLDHRRYYGVKSDKSDDRPVEHTHEVQPRFVHHSVYNVFQNANANLEARGTGSHVSVVMILT